jgi:hypothetical protein
MVISGQLLSLIGIIVQIIRGYLLKDKIRKRQQEQLV